MPKLLSVAVVLPACVDAYQVRMSLVIAMGLESERCRALSDRRGFIQDLWWCCLGVPSMWCPQCAFAAVEYRGRVREAVSIANSAGQRLHIRIARRRSTTSALVVVGCGAEEGLGT